MSERMCKYCMCSSEPENLVISVNQEDICETCIRIAAEVAREMGALGRE